MKTWVYVFALVLATAGFTLAEAGKPAERPRSENFRLEEFAPDGGRQKMTSERFRMESTINPPPDPMESENFRMIPLEPRRRPALPIMDIP